MQSGIRMMLGVGLKEETFFKKKKTKNCVLHVTLNAGCIFSVVGRSGRTENKKLQKCVWTTTFQVFSFRRIKSPENKTSLWLNEIILFLALKWTLSSY